MKHGFILMAFVAIATESLAGIVNTATMDTSSFAIKGKVTVEGYIDAYYAYDFNKPGKDQPYFVSMARNNEVNINLSLR